MLRTQTATRCVTPRRRAARGARSLHKRRAQGDEDAEDAAEDEAEDEAADAQAEADAAKPPPKAAPEPERQLSKKELKKKELEDMEAVLAELGISVPARPPFEHDCRQWLTTLACSLRRLARRRPPTAAPLQASARRL